MPLPFCDTDTQCAGRGRDSCEVLFPSLGKFLDTMESQGHCRWAVAAVDVAAGAVDGEYSVDLDKLLDDTKDEHASHDVGEEDVKDENKDCSLTCWVL